jgi:hypothetical protein
VRPHAGRKEQGSKRCVDANPVLSPLFASARARAGISGCNGTRSSSDNGLKLGIEKTAMIRVRAGISYALTEAMDEGTAAYPRTN